MTVFTRWLASLFLLLAALTAQAQTTPLKFGVGLFQPDRERNDATYRPLAQHLSQRPRRLSAENSCAAQKTT